MNYCLNQYPQLAPVLQQPVTFNSVLDMNTMTEHLTRLGEDPVAALCPNCQTQGLTVTQKRTGNANYLVSGLCLLNPCLWCGCCLIPCFIPKLKDTQHKCMTCGEILGRKKKL